MREGRLAPPDSNKKDREAVEVYAIELLIVSMFHIIISNSRDEKS